MRPYRQIRGAGSFPFVPLVVGVGFEGDGGRVVCYLFLEIATITIPSTAIATAGATVLPVAPEKKSHAANAMQMSPTISLSFLTCIYVASINSG